MTTPVWAPGTLYQPGDLVRPRSATGGVATQPSNPGFETGSLSDWTLNPLDGGGSGSVVTGQTCGSNNFFDGTHGFLWEAQAGGGGGTGPGGGWSAELVNDFRAVVAVGQSITARCYARSVPCNRKHWTWAAIRIYWFNESDEVVAISEELNPYGSGSNGFGTTGQWVQSSVTATAPAGATHASIGAFLTTREDSTNGSYVDAFTWDYISPSGADNLVFRAVQAAAGFSGAEEPIWPVILGETVYDNEVTWEAVATSRVVWEASPILVSGSVEPDFPDQVDGNVVDNTIVWKALSRRITDPKCPHSKIVAIAASKVFAGDEDIIAYCSTVNPLDWSSPNDAGYLPFGLQTYGANPVSGLGLYRSNLVAFNSSGYQMWQVDPNPANMAILDAQPIPCDYHLSIQPVANDLVFLTSLGIRNIAIAGASTNLQAGFFGKQVDPLVKDLLAAAILAGFDPWGLFWPGQGQYWLFFGTTAMVLTMNGGEKDMSWSRYIFPATVTDWCIDGTTLFLRAGDLVWEVSDDANAIDGPADDVYCDLDGAPVLTLDSRVGTSNHLSWTAVTGAIGYKLYNAMNDELIADVGTLTYVDSGLEELTDYTYYVVAYNVAHGVSPHSNTVDGPIGGPAAPVLDGEVQSDNESALLSWTAATTTGGPITGYRLYDADTATLIVDTMNPATLSHLDSGLALDTVYSYYVTSYTAQTESANSNTVILDTGHPLTVIDVYLSDFTWTKRAGLVSADVTVIGGGAGGAGGSTNPGTGGHHGSIGGTGGGFASFSILASFLGATETGTVGASGAGGTGAVVSFGGGGGGTGGAGGDSTFGAWATSQGGLGGNADPGTGAPIENLGGQATITASSGPTSKITERGGKANSLTGGGNTTYAGAGGAGGACGGAGNTSPGACANSGIPYFGGNGGGGGTPLVTDAAGNAGSSGVLYGAGGGAGGDANKSSAFPIVTYRAGNGAPGSDGVVVVVNHLS